MSSWRSVSTCAAGQRLLIEGSLLTGVDVALVPFVRRLAEAAYRRGAAFVDVLWRDPQQDIIRLKESPGFRWSITPAGRAQPGWSTSRQGMPCLRSTPMIRICWPALTRD